MRSRQGVLHCVGCQLDVRHGAATGVIAASVSADDATVSCSLHLSPRLQHDFDREEHIAPCLCLHVHRAAAVPGD